MVCGNERQLKTDGKHMTALFNKSYFLQLLRVGQSYFANQAEWDNLFQFTTRMLKLCGYVQNNTGVSEIDKTFLLTVLITPG
jgi:hypothetical protein